MREQKIVKLISELLGIILLALFCLLLWCPPEKRPIFQEKLKEYKVHYGLDIAGGARLIYEIDPEKITGTKSVEEVLDHTKTIIERRIIDTDVKDPIIKTIGDNRISVELPGVSEEETDRVKEQIKTLGKLQFRMRVAYCEADKVDVSKKLGTQLGTKVDARAEWRTYQRKLNAGEEVLEQYQKELEQTKGVRWFKSKESHGNRVYLLWIKDGYDFEGGKFQNFYEDSDLERGPIIGFELKDEYKNRFAEFMDRYKSQEISPQNIEHELMAIVYNNEVIMAPSIDAEHPPQGSGTISGNFTRDQVKNMISILRSGSLEVEPTFVQRKSQGATYGEDAIRMGILAGWIGLIVVGVFMVIYYRISGLIAIIALALNVVLIFAVLVISKETLTLPGIAGIVLTIGMSVDANILIFERIREEQRKRRELQEETGKDSAPRESTQQEILENLEQGYSKAMTTIIDSNLTTFFTALILYFFATGTVQGFAFTLGVGIVASFFTAIFVTRVCFHILLETGLLRQINMLQLVRNPNFPFSKYMVKAGIASLALIVLGMALFFYMGQRIYGLDLRGGVEAHIAFKEPQTTAEVRERVNKVYQKMKENEQKISGKTSKSPETDVHHFAQSKQKSPKGWYEFSLTFPNLNQEAIDKKQGQLRKLWFDLRNKREEQKEIYNSITRKRDAREKAEKEKSNLQAENAEALAIRNIEDRIKSYDDEVKADEKIAAKLSTEIEKVQLEEKVLLAEKDKLIEVEPLKEELRREFGNILALPAFGKMEEVRWGEDARKYYQLPVCMLTPVSVEFVKQAYNIGQEADEKTKGKALKYFVRMELGVVKYGLWLKLEKAMGNPQQEIFDILEKQFDLTAQITLKNNQIVVEKSSSSNWDYYLTMNFEKAVPESAIDSVLKKCGFGKYELSMTDKDSTEIKDFHLFMIPTSETSLLKLDEIEKRAQEIAKKIKDKKYQGDSVYLSEPFPMVDQVSGAVAQAQKAKSYQAIFLALIMMLVYIALRFPTGFRFGTGAVVALAHDVAISIGAMALCFAIGIVDVKMTIPAIAALLTIVGYSVNDTIVIFDRIRENRKKHEIWERLTFKQVQQEFDKALNQTLSRTFLTALTTLFVVIIIFILNFRSGTVLEGFSFLMIVGLIAGTYSSLFIATPIVLLFEKREHE